MKKHCKNENENFITELDLDGNLVSFRKTAVEAFGASQSEKYKSWIVVGKEKIFLLTPHTELLKQLQ